MWIHYWLELQYNTIQIKLRWALFVTYTIIQSIMRSEMCSLHLTHPSAQTADSGQWAADCAAPGEQSWTSCRSRDSNRQPWVTSGFKSNALSTRPRLPEIREGNIILHYCITATSRWWRWKRRIKFPSSTQQAAKLASTTPEPRPPEERWDRGCLGSSASEVFLIIHAEGGGARVSLPPDHPAKGLSCVSRHLAECWVQTKMYFRFLTGPQ